MGRERDPAAQVLPPADQLRPGLELSILPGRFNPWGSTIAAYFLVTGITGLVFLGFSSFIQDMFYGGASILAVTLSKLVRGRQEQQFQHDRPRTDPTLRQQLHRGGSERADCW
jgi:hypothetical protein